jgi:urease accessory protein
VLHSHAFVPAHEVGKRPFADSVVLTFEDRRRRRGVITTLGRLDILVDLAQAPALAHGDAYELEDGRLVEIVAEAERLLEIRARDPLHLARLAWHLGNRHLETEIGPKWLRIRDDHVIAEMLAGQGAKVVAIEGPFQPEGGAYEHGGHHEHGSHEHEHHDHGHSHDHEHHDHGHSHDHEHHDHGHSHDHEHHDHGHSHDHEHATPPDPRRTGPADERRDRMNDAPQYR